MENKDTKLNKVILVIFVVFIAALLWFSLGNKDAYAPISNVGNNAVIEGNKDDLVSFSIDPNSTVSGIIFFEGSVKNAYFFEANVLINILDINKNILKRSNAMATTDWMTAGPVSFEGNIDLTGLPKGPAYFEIHNDNASGLPENDKSILIPITIN